MKMHISEIAVEPAAMRRAFEAGVAYHDALMAHSVQAPEARGTVIEGSARLEELFEAWHIAIAEALGVAP